MLIAVLFLVGLATAARVCYETLPKPDWLSHVPCSDACLLGDTAHLEGICADNPKGFCELDGGVAAYFRVFTSCLSRSCPSDDDRMYFVTGFRAECGFFDASNSTQAQLFGDWKKYFSQGLSIDTDEEVTKPQQSTTAQAVMSVSTKPATSINAERTVTHTHGTTVESPAVTTTSAFVWPSSNATATKNDSVATVLGDETSSILQATSSVSSVPSTFQAEEPVLSTAAIVGIAVGSTSLFTLCLGAAFLLYRRKQNQPKNQPQSMSVLTYEPQNSRAAYEKAELDGHALEHQYPESGVGSPSRYAELDAVTPVSPVREQVYISASERNARVAQNF